MATDQTNTQAAISAEMQALLAMTMDAFDDTVSPGVYAGQIKANFKGDIIWIRLENLVTVGVDDPTTAKPVQPDTAIMEKWVCSPNVGGPDASSVDWQRTRRNIRVFGNLIGKSGKDSSLIDVLTQLQDYWVFCKVGVRTYTVNGEERKAQTMQWIKATADRPADILGGDVPM
jgi:hypothetical protein